MGQVVVVAALSSSLLCPIWDSKAKALDAGIDQGLLLCSVLSVPCGTYKFGYQELLRRETTATRYYIGQGCSGLGCPIWDSFGKNTVVSTLIPMTPTTTSLAVIVSFKGMYFNNLINSGNRDYSDHINPTNRLIPTLLQIEVS